MPVLSNFGLFCKTKRNQTKRKFNMFWIYVLIKITFYLILFLPLLTRKTLSRFICNRIKQQQREKDEGFFVLDLFSHVLEGNRPCLYFFFLLTQKSVLKRKLRNIETISMNVRQRVTSNHKTLVAASGFRHKGIEIKQEMQTLLICLALNPQVIASRVY